MRTFDQWLTDEIEIDESLLGRAFSRTIDFIDLVCNKADEAVRYVNKNGPNWGRRVQRHAKQGIDYAAGEVGYAATHPVETGEKAALAVPKAMWLTFQKLRYRYGLAAAVGIMAVCVSLHFAVPGLVLVPASSVIGAAPGAAVAETWHQIRTSNSLLRQGVQGIAHLLHLDGGGKENLTPDQIKKLGHEAYEELQEAIQKAAHS